MITTDKTQLNINVLTQEQYEQAKADETLDQDGLYMIDDDIHQMGIELDFNGVEKRELLWTNPNPSADFVAQTIPLDLSGYDEILIFMRYHKQFGTSVSEQCKIGESLHANFSAGTTTSAYYIENLYREASALPGGVAFSTAYLVRNGGAPTQTDEYMIPTRIYGIKKLQPSYNVIPQQVDYVVDNRDGKRVWKSGKIEQRRSGITLRFDGSQTLTTTSVLMGFTGVLAQAGTELSFSNASHGIVVGKNINFVLVSAEIACGSGMSAGNTLYLDIYKNGSIVLGGGYATAHTTSAKLVLAPKLISVSEGDILTTMVRGTAAGGNISTISSMSVYEF